MSLVETGALQKETDWRFRPRSEWAEESTVNPVWRKIANLSV